MKCQGILAATTNGTIVAEERHIIIRSSDAAQSGSDTSTGMDPDADQDWCPED